MTVGDNDFPLHIFASYTGEEQPEIIGITCNKYTYDECIQTEVEITSQRVVMGDGECEFILTCKPFDLVKPDEIVITYAGNIEINDDFCDYTQVYCRLNGFTFDISSDIFRFEPAEYIDISID